MSEHAYAETEGKTTVAPDVLLTIARLAALEVNGVSHLGIVPSSTVRLFQRDHVGEGVALQIQGETVSADIYVLLKSDLNVQEIGRNIQHEVTRAISEMVGMHVKAVNIHIEDVVYPIEAEA